MKTHNRITVIINPITARFRGLKKSPIIENNKPNPHSVGSAQRQNINILKESEVLVGINPMRITATAAIASPKPIVPHLFRFCAV
jgi:hypothetical protein